MSSSCANPDLWQTANAIHARMRGLFGDAAAIAARVRHGVCIKLVRAWVRWLEAIVRQLVLIEAAALKPAKPPPLMTLIAPPPRSGGGALSFTTDAARTPSLRLWPRTPPPARFRALGPPLLVRDLRREQMRVAAAGVLNAVRFMRRSEPERLARRISALAAVLAKPWRAAKRLAAKLRRFPDIAGRIARRRPPRSEHADYALQHDVIRRCARFAADSS